MEDRRMKKKLKRTFFCFLFFVLSFSLLDSDITFAGTCQIPQDVVIVFDSSANMLVGDNYETIKTKSNDFIYKDETSGLFSTTPSAILDENKHHQIGLISFNDYINITEDLTDDYNFIKNKITALIEPNGGRNLTDAVGNARSVLENSSNNESNKTMIVIVSGPPNDSASLKTMLDLAKSDSEIIAIGVGLDALPTDDRSAAESIITYSSAISPNNCFYIKTNEYSDDLANCINLPFAELGIELKNIYSNITSAICDEVAPTIAINRLPTNETIYNNEKFSINSYAIDDTGFLDHSMTWKLNGFSTTKDNCDLIPILYGTDLRIDCQITDLGPFASGSVISYQSSVKDLQDNVVSSGLKSFTIATTSLTVSNPFTRNKDNAVTIRIQDPQGFASFGEYFLRVDNKDSLNSINIIDENNLTSKMNSCTGNGQDRYCTYNLNIGCPSIEYPYDTADISVFTKIDGILNSSPLNTSFDRQIVTGGESITDGNCSDGKDNDCDGITDGEELLCDATPPSVAIERTVPAEASVFYDNNLSFTLESSNATDDSGIKEHMIEYKRSTDAAWIEAIRCNNVIAPFSECDNIPENVITFSVSITPTFAMSAGTVIQYRSRVVDNSGNNNEYITPIKSFEIKSFECDNVTDLGACAVSVGKCCGGICNATIDNSDGYDGDCAKEVCVGNVWKKVLDSSKDNITPNCEDESDGSATTGCFAFSPLDPSIPVNIPITFYDPITLYNNDGCEDRSYNCQSGYCNYFENNRKNDSCNLFASPKVFQDFECDVSNECKKNHEWEDGKCDNSVSFTELTVADGTDVNMTGAPEVLDSLTDEIKISAHVADPSGILSYKIFWKVNGGVWQEKDCGSCGSSTEATACICTQKIGPFIPGDSVSYYMWSQDDSPNQNQEYVAQSDIMVRDNECYTIPLDYSSFGNDKVNLGLCNNTNSGRCCGGYCDSSLTVSSVYDSECTVETCSGDSWVTSKENTFNIPLWLSSKNDEICGSTNTCEDFQSFGNYTGCRDGGNKCDAGFCKVDPLSSYKPSSCSGSQLNTFSCQGGYTTGSCVSDITNPVECSSVGDFDADGLACNCDCGGYDIKEEGNSSLSFDGVDDYVSVPSVNPTNAISVEAWVKSDSISGYSGVWQIISKYSAFILGTSLNNSSEMCFIIYDSTWQYGSCYSVPDPENWHHFIGTYDKSTQEKKLYVDGILRDTTNPSGTIRLDTGPIHIGKRESSLSGYNFKGQIDEVRIYDRALSESEVQDHYSGQYLNNTGLLSFWNFDEGVGETVEDSSGNGNDGSLNNIDGNLYNMNNSDWVDGKYGSGLDFDGSNDYVAIQNSASLNPEKITLEAWVYPTSFNYYGNIINKRYPAQYILRFYSSTGRIQGFIYDSGWRYCTTSTDVAANLNEWNHIVQTYDGTIGKLYINDVEGCTYFHNGAIDSGSSILKIGSYRTTSSSSERVKGKIDEVRIYDRAISETEVLEHYRGIYADNAGLIGYWDFNENNGSIVHDKTDNGPQWKKYFSVENSEPDFSSILNRVPENYRVCSDGINNDCDLDVDEAQQSCDNRIDGVSIRATRVDSNLVTQNISSIVREINNNIIDQVANDFTIISENATDDYHTINNVEIEWTINNWATNPSSQRFSCSGNSCTVCVNGGSCVNDKINRDLLLAGNTIKYRACAWDTSDNNNMGCTEELGFFVKNSNEAPVVSNGEVMLPDLCKDGLKRTLSWNFTDGDGDLQESYHIMVKKGNNNFTNGPFVVNKTVFTDIHHESYHTIIADDNKFMGTASGGTVNKLEGAGNTWVSNEWKNGIIKITSGTGAGQERSVSSNTSDSITVNLNWDTIPDATSEYEITSINIEYGNEYYWQVQATDNRSPSQYALTSSFVEGTNFTTPSNSLPDPNFVAYGIDATLSPPAEDESKDCSSEVFQSINENNKCLVGQEIIFHDTSVLIECNNSVDCMSASRSKCVGTSCTPCISGDTTCDKFDHGGINYECSSDNVCIPTGECATSDDCKSTDFALCEAPSCVPCNTDILCDQKFGVGYTCNSGICEYADRRKWDFDDNGVINSILPDPKNIFIGNNIYHFVKLIVKDPIGGICSKKKKIPLKGELLPKWNEISPIN